MVFEPGPIRFHCKIHIHANYLSFVDKAQCKLKAVDVEIEEFSVIETNMPRDQLHGILTLTQYLHLASSHHHA